MTENIIKLLEKEFVRTLGKLDSTRALVQNLDNALSLLSPEERIVANLLLLQPDKNNIFLVCQQLNLEPSSVYRWRKKVIHKLMRAVMQVRQ